MRRIVEDIRIEILLTDEPIMSQALVIAGGYLNINKDRGWTSTDVVRKLKGVTRSKKIGHGGTLDPIATGVLPICILSLIHI